MKCPNCFEAMKRNGSHKMTETKDEVFRQRHYRCGCGIRLVAVVSVRTEILSICGKERVA